MEPATAAGAPRPTVRDGRELLSTIQHIAIAHLVKALDAAVRRTDDYLFDNCSRGDGSELAAMGELRRLRVRLSHDYESALAAGFGKLGFSADETQAYVPELSLLSTEDLEEQLATEQLVDNLVRRHAGSLELLDKRLASLLDSAALVDDENPVSPAAIASALNDALRIGDLPMVGRIALYKFIERELTEGLAPLYDRLNASLADAGVLPRLKATARNESVAAVRDRSSATEEPAAAAPRPDEAKPAATTQDAAMFDGLLDLLQSWRGRDGSALTGARPAASASLGMPEMLSVLSVLQNDPPKTLDLGAEDTRVSLADRLRQEVVMGARRLGVSEEGLSLSPVQEDAVDLVGMLFDVMLDERDFEPDVRRKIGRMLVPYVKVAVKDRRLFLYKGHPARRFLNLVAEACVGNHGEGPKERELLEQVDASIDRLMAEFNEDLAIFETLEQELRGILTQYQKRFEIAERRAAEAQAGRERLGLARSQATDELASRRGDRHLPQALVDFLDRYGWHHLVQVSLREGSGSDAYRAALTTVQGLLEAFDEAGQVGGQAPMVDSQGMKAILSSYGCEGHSAEDVLVGIEQCLAAVRSGDTLPTHTPAPVPEPRPDTRTRSKAAELRIVGGHDQLDFDPVVAEQMRTLEVGTWVHLTAESGSTDLAKVSWISPISSRLLLVNRRGIRVLVASAEELAALAQEGRIRIDDTGFDGAIQRMMARMQADAKAC